MKIYSSLSLRWQILLPILLLGFLILIIGFTGYQGISAVSDKSSVMATRLTPATSAILNADRDLYQAATAMRDYINAKQSGADRNSAKKDFDDNIDQATKRMMKARDLVSSTGVDITSEQEFKNKLSQWKMLALKVLQLADSGDNAAALTLINNQESKAFGELRDQYDALGEKIDQRSTELAEAIIKTEQRETATTITVLLLALGIFLMAIIFGPNTVIAPIKQLEKMLSELASGNGDLTQRIPVPNSNEISQLAKQVNRFTQFLQTMIAEAQLHTKDMAKVVDELCQNSEQTSSSAQHQQQSVQQVHTAVSELQNAIHEIASSAQHSSGEAEQVHKDVAESNDAINLSSNQINTLSSDMENVVHLIGELEQESNNIASVLDVIGGIAEQTNLLALNAAIEAARAGEAGRGFAVVADEVRTLASKTQQSTQDIQEMIERLQNGVSNAVKAMQSANTQVSDTVTNANQAAGALDRIVQGVDNINDMSTQIAAATEEQSSVAMHMNETINDVSHHTSELNNLADKTHMAGNKLNQLTSALSGHMHKFKV